MSSCQGAGRYAEELADGRVVPTPEERVKLPQLRRGEGTAD